MTTTDYRPGDQRKLFEASTVYFILGLINLRAKLLATPAWFDGTLSSNHAQLLAFNYTNNEQSRILQFGIPELLVRLTGCDVPTAYIIQRWLFVTLTFVAFHIYLRRWFTELACFTAVVLFAAFMPLTYQNDLQESSPLLMFLFLLILWAIREGRTWPYSGLLLFGALNNETVLILPAVYFFVYWPGWKWRHVIHHVIITLVTALPAYAYTAFIRYVTRSNPHLGPVIQLPFNLRSLAADASEFPVDWWHAEHLHFILLFGVLWLYVIVDVWQKPSFLRRGAIMIPLFILAHFITGRIAESRQMLPLAPIVIPMALMSLFPESLRPQAD